MELKAVVEELRRCEGTNLSPSVHAAIQRLFAAADAAAPQQLAFPAGALRDLVGIMETHGVGSDVTAGVFLAISAQEW